MEEKTGVVFEMSRYIDLDLYHRVEKTHPFYIEMVEEMCGWVERFAYDRSQQVRALELGAGTGLLTKELLKYPFLQVHALELDSKCCEILRGQINGHPCTVIQGDAVRYRRSKHFDLVVSSFAHDHIHYDHRAEFAENIRENLRPGGLYIMGGELLPAYTSMADREDALYRYHTYIVNKAMRERHFEVAQIEINALKSGIEMCGDFKRHEAMFEEEMASANLELLSKKKIGPQDQEGVGGVFVYVYRRKANGG